MAQPRWEAMWGERKIERGRLLFTALAQCGRHDIRDTRSHNRMDFPADTLAHIERGLCALWSPVLLWPSCYKWIYCSFIYAQERFYSLYFSGLLLSSHCVCSKLTSHPPHMSAWHFVLLLLLLGVGVVFTVYCWGIWRELSRPTMPRT